MYDETTITKISKQNLAQRTTNLRWLFRQPEEVQLEAMKIQTSIIRAEQRQGAKLSDELKLGALASAVNILRKVEQGQQRKTSEDLSVEDFERTEHIRILILKNRKRTKRNTKEGKIIAQIENIKKLKAEGLSYCRIAEYLKTYSKLDVTGEAIRLVFKKLDIK